MDAKDLLIADLEHFEESLWRNEEIGEKRFSFFVTLVTAVAGGLVAFYTRDESQSWKPEQSQPLIAAASGVLLLICVLSYLRMLHRNHVTDQYKKTIRYIRATYCAKLGLAEYCVPIASGNPGKVEGFRKKWLRGGYAETMAVMAGIIFAVFIWALKPSLSGIAIIPGVAVAFILWVLAARREKTVP